jgi:hypothetical protein
MSEDDNFSRNVHFLLCYIIVNSITMLVVITITILLIAAGNDNIPHVVGIKYHNWMHQYRISHFSW